MSLASRIGKLEEKLAPQKGNIYFIGWANCEWRHAEGLVRGKNESKEAFLRRVKTSSLKNWIWCK